MNIVVIMGSPRRAGKTREVVDKLERTLVDSGDSVEIVNLADLRVAGCLGCNKCFEGKEKPYCAQRDDAQSLFDRIQSADVAVYASPLYAFSFPAQMKAFLDRHYCLVTNPGLPDQSSLLEGKKVAMLVTCCDPVEHNADLVSVVFDRLFKRLKCDVIGEYIAELSFSDGFDARAGKVAAAMARDIRSRA